MQISAMTSAVPALSAVRVPETKEVPGPDRDGDTDDQSAISQKPVAAAPLRMGHAIDMAA